MKKNVKIFCLAALTVFICVSSASAEETWTTYTEAEGLVNNYVGAIAVGTDNVKWFGTGNGVSSFDGTTWTTFTTDDGLVGNYIRAIAVDADNVKWFGVYGVGVSRFGEIPVSVENPQNIPAVIDIRENFPNPFNPSTTLQYAIPEGTSFHVKLNVYDVRGALVRTLVNQIINPGIHSVLWDGTDQTGNKVSSGVYLYRIQAGRFSKTNKMLLIR